jgi:Domain of unknown function (DUF4055)
MPPIPKQDRPDYPCQAYQRMAPGWTVVRDISGTALTLRAKGRDYLPQFPAEHDKIYESRLKTATLFNAYKRTVQALVGMVFKKNPVLGADVPMQISGRAEEIDGDTGKVVQERVEGHVENIDLAGTHFDVFCREVFEDAFEGHAFVLVDMQKPLAPGATLEDEQKAGMRPYWVKYRASQALNFRAVTINGRKEIGQITFEELTTTDAGEFGEAPVKRYRTFRLAEYLDEEGRPAHQVEWKLRELRRAENGEESFPEIDGGTIKSFDRIPVAVIYGRRVDFLESQPPLLDLALLNISYYQKKSDRDRNLHLCGSPTPLFSGVPDDWDMLVTGAGFGIKLPTGATGTYLEPQGVALEESGKDLQELRSEMAAIGLSTLEGGPQAKATATEKVIDFSQESCELETIARSAQDGFELCLQFHARYIGLASGGSLTLGSHLKALRLSQAQVQAFSNMAAASPPQISLRLLWDILERADMLPEDFDPAVEEERIKNQVAELGLPAGPPPAGGADTSGQQADGAGA